MTPPQNSSTAIAFMLSATLFIATSTLMAKLAADPAYGDPLHPLQVSHGRFLFAFLAISAVFAARRRPLERPAYRLHLVRSAFGWGGVTLMFAAVTFIPMADATAISFLNPVFAMIFAIPFLGERVGPVRWSAAAIAFCGALVLLRPSPQSFEMGGLIALGAALLMGAEIVVIKRLSGVERPLQILFVNNAIGLSIATLAVLPVWQMPSAEQWVILAGVGLAMATAQFFFVSAMARAEASFVAPFAFATLLFATFYDGAIFGKWPDAITGLGAGIIIAGAGLLAWRESRLKTSKS